MRKHSSLGFPSYQLSAYLSVLLFRHLSTFINNNRHLVYLLQHLRHSLRSQYIPKKHLNNLQRYLRLHDISSIQAINTIGPKNALLLLDYFLLITDKEFLRLYVLLYRIDEVVYLFVVVAFGFFVKVILDVF